MARKQNLKAIDFFCGAGGLTRGFLDAGIKVIAGIDCEQECEKTFTKNNKPATFICADLRNMPVQDLEKYVRRIPREQLVFAACAPCQPFAPLNKSGGKGRDAFLLSDFARFVSHYHPKYVFLENVPGIARKKGASTLARFKSLITRLGYKFSDGVVDAKSYGVPQTRRRYIFLAARGVSVSLPTVTHGPGKKRIQTVKDAIGHLPPVKSGKSHKSVKNHVASPLSELNLRRLRATPKNGGSRTSWPPDLVLKCHKQHDGHTDIYGRMAWDQPAPTLTCACNSISNGRYGHPTQNRAITLREAAALQSFRDSYVFYSDMRSYIARKIGNAVPVMLAKAVALHIVATHVSHPFSRSKQRAQG
jgi:DNA (cytosine-5)-methyltransferase 1